MVFIAIWGLIVFMLSPIFVLIVAAFVYYTALQSFKADNVFHALAYMGGALISVALLASTAYFLFEGLAWVFYGILTREIL